MTLSDPDGHVLEECIASDPDGHVWESALLPLPHITACCCNEAKTLAYYSQTPTSTSNLSIFLDSQ